MSLDQNDEKKRSSAKTMPETTTELTSDTGLAALEEDIGVDDEATETTADSDEALEVVEAEDGIAVEREALEEFGFGEEEAYVPVAVDADQPVIEAFFDSVRGGLATGWIWDRNAPDSHLIVELWVDGVKAAEGAADRLRTDLQRAGIGQGDHAFAVGVPELYHDGLPHQVTMREALTGTEFAKNIVYQADKSLQAKIVGVDGGALLGWVAREFPKLKDFEIAIWEGDQEVAKGRANRPSTVPYGLEFRVALPNRMFDGYPHRLSLRDAAGETLDETELTLPFALVAGVGEHKSEPLPTMEGYIDSVRGGVVEGWVYNHDEPDESLPIELWVDDTLVMLAQADKLRPDLAEAGAGEGYHAFSLELPQQYRDGRVYHIKVRESRSGFELKPGVVEFQADDTLRFHLDGVRGAALVGWVARDFGGVHGMSLSVWENGENISSGVAEQPVDVPNGAAFHLPLPPRLFDGRVHYFIVKNADNERLGSIAEAMPYISTPEDALQAYGGTPLRGTLFQSAGRRYESLRYQFAVLPKSLPKDDATARQRLVDIFAAHEQLVLGFQHNKRRFEALPKLHFPTVESPDASLVIPVHNKFEVTYHCLASLLVSSNEASFEVIVVDDGSQDDTLKIAEVISGITVVRNEAAQGFVRASNKGGTLARGRYVVMLNNDTEVGPRWLDELLVVFRDHKNVGMVGAKFIYPNGVLQEAGGIVWSNGDPWNYGRNGNPYDPRYNYVRDVDYLSGACVMLPTPLWKELGGFDELFVPAYFEDTDLAFRVRAKGLRTVYTPFSEIVHFEGISSGTSTSSGMKRFQEINRPKFKKRHGPACYYNGTYGEQVELNKDRNIRYRVLVIDATSPTPDKDAGSYAAIQEMKLLQSFACKLTFMPENLAYLGKYTEDLQHMGVECVYAPFVTSPRDFLRDRGAEFDAVYITRYTVAEKYIDMIRELAPKARILFNNADLHFLRELRFAISNYTPERMEQALRTRDAELAVMRAVDVTLSYNEVEHAVIMSHNLNSSKVAKCPWVVDLPAKVPGYKERRDIAFLGGYGHYPNVEAVEAFVAEVMPLLRERLPGVRFVVYGSNAPKSFQALESDDVILAGWVEDVAQVYDTCRVFIAPLKSGAGLKGKVVGALAHGVPSVVSPIAAEGIGLRDGLEVRIAAKPDDWAEAIASLYEDEAAWQACSNAARKFAAGEYSFEQGRALMGEALAQIGIFAADA